MEADPGDGGTDDNREHRRVVHLRSIPGTQSMEASPPDRTPSSRRPSVDIPPDFLPCMATPPPPPTGPPHGSGALPVSTPPRTTLALRPLRPQHSSASGTLQTHTPTQQRLWLMEGSEGGGAPPAAAAAAASRPGAPSDAQEAAWSDMEQGGSTTPRVVLRAVRSLQENLTRGQGAPGERDAGAVDAGSTARPLHFRPPSVVSFDWGPGLQNLGLRGAHGHSAAVGAPSVEFVVPQRQHGSGLGAAYGLVQQQPSPRPSSMPLDPHNLVQQQRQQQPQQQQQQQQQPQHQQQMQRQGGALGQIVLHAPQMNLGALSGPVVDEQQDYEDDDDEDDAVISQTTVPIGDLPVETIDVTVAVRIGASSSRRPKSGSGRAMDDDLKTGYVKGPICGVFDLKRYLAETSCIKYKGEYVSRSAFEKEGKSKMAKWYRSIRALPDLMTMEDWLKRYGLPVLKGPPRRSRKQAERKAGPPRARELQLTASPQADSNSAGAHLPTGTSNLDSGRMRDSDPLASIPGRPTHPQPPKQLPNNLPIRHPDPRFLQRLMNTLPASQHFMVPGLSLPEPGSSLRGRDATGSGSSAHRAQFRLSELTPRVSSCGGDEGHASALHPPAAAAHGTQAALMTQDAADAERLNATAGLQTAPRDEGSVACVPQGTERHRAGGRGGDNEVWEVSDSDPAAGNRLQHPGHPAFDNSADRAEQIQPSQLRPQMPVASRTPASQMPPHWAAAAHAKMGPQGPAMFRPRSGQVPVRHEDYLQEGKSSEVGEMDCRLPRVQSTASAALPMLLPTQPPPPAPQQQQQQQQPPTYGQHSVQPPLLPVLQPLPRRRRRRDDLDVQDGQYSLPGASLDEQQSLRGAPLTGWPGTYANWEYPYGETQQQQQQLPQQLQQQQQQQLHGEHARQLTERSEHQRVLRITPLSETSPQGGQGPHGGTAARIPAQQMQESQPQAVLRLRRANAMAGNAPDDRDADGQQAGQDAFGQGPANVGTGAGAAEQGVGQGRDHSRFRATDNRYMYGDLGADSGGVEILGAHTDNPQARRRRTAQFEK
uniref:RegA n=1 Tax=Volvox ferrisii TaxID=1075618 RepID=A0A075M6Z9_9CHLO|nr:RegA [Volvox ferrisii]